MLSQGGRNTVGTITALLAAHPAVQECLVVPRAGESGAPGLVAYVVPRPPEEPDHAPAGPDQAQVRGWQAHYERIYRQPAPYPDPALNTVGWQSYETGQALAAAEMREWVDGTVGRITPYAPQRVLELGCGTGLLLWRLAPGCQAYWGTDFVPRVLDTLATQLARATPPLAQVTLLPRPADDFTGIPAAYFDLVILNSVVQYFPSVGYLLRVLAGASGALAPGGRIFVGDVRSLPLQEAFHALVALHQAPPELARAALRRRLQGRLAQEQELLLDPAFFAALPRACPTIQHVEIQLKRGRSLNELTRFRYDVLLSTQAAAPPADRPTLDWPAGVSSIADIRRQLIAEAPAALRVVGVPNARLRAQLTAGPQGVDPEDVWALSAALPYTATISWSAASPGCFDIVFRRNGAAAPGSGDPAPAVTGSAPGEEAQERSWTAYANTPATSAAWLGPELRRWLRTRLAADQDGAVVVLPALPRTPTGAIDRGSLPVPAEPTPPARPAGSLLEEVIAAVWADLLGLARVGVDDDLAALGGQAALQAAAHDRVQAAIGRPLPAAALPDPPPVATWAAAIERGIGPAPACAPGPDQSPASALSPELPLAVALALQGRLDGAALDAGLQEIGRRHAVLCPPPGAPGARLPLVTVDLQDRPPALRVVEALRLAQAATQGPVDLAAGPAVRAVLYRLGGDEHLLLLAVHPAVADDASRGIFVQELALLYTAYAQGQPPPWSPVGGQRPARSGPPRAVSVARQCPLHLSRAVQAGLERGGQQAGAPLRAVLLAGLAAALAECLGQSALLLGTPTIQRTRPEEWRRVAPLERMLWMRLDSGAGCAGPALLGQVTRQLLAAYLGPDQPEAGRPLAGVAPEALEIVLRLGLPIPSYTVVGLAIAPLELDYMTIAGDLLLDLRAGASGLAGTLVYAQHRFDPPTIDRLLAQYYHVLASLAA